MYTFITQTSGPYDDHCRSLRKNAIAELTRTWAERREPKKKQAAQKQAQKQGIDDADLINPNHIENLKELKMSDLFSAQWSRR